MQWPSTSSPTRSAVMEGRAHGYGAAAGRLAGLALLAAAAGCSAPAGDGPVADGAGSAAYEQDGLPHPSARLSPEQAMQIADATPRREPRSLYGNQPMYSVHGRTYRTRSSSGGFVERGLASWYGRKFQKRLTSSREPYDMFAMTAAHRTLPLPTYVRVTRLDNGRSIVVRVNDRGPFRAGRVIDLSYVAAVKLGIDRTGTAPVEVRALEPPADEEAPAPGAAAEARAPADPGEGEEAGSGAAAGEGEEEDAPAASPPGRARVYVQIGAYRKPSNAERAFALASQLRPGLARIVRVRQEEGVLHRVRLGPFDAVEDVDRALKDLAAHGRDDVRLVVERDGDGTAGNEGS